MNLLAIQSYALLDIPKIHTDLLWDLTLLFSILAVVYFGVIFFFRNKFTSKTKLISERKKQLSPMISEFLFYDTNDATKEDHKNYIHLKIEIRDLIKDEFNHQILSDILIDLQKDVSGETLERLYRLFKDLGLHNKAYEKLESYRWQIVSQGIMELTQMRVTESYEFIAKLINDKRGTVRKQAEMAAVTLEEKGIGHFLDTTRYQISQWQQLKLMDILRNRQDFQPPRFKRWLTSNNKAVVLFALRLLKFYDQNDANAMLIQLVRHKNKQIKEEAISCIQKFGVEEALDTLKMGFWNSNVNCKILILDTVTELGSEKDIDFLQKVERKSFNFVVKSKALSCIHMLQPETALDMEGLEDSSVASESEPSEPLSTLDELNIQKEEEHLEGIDPDPIEIEIQEDLPSGFNVIEEPIAEEDKLEPETSIHMEDLEDSSEQLDLEPSETLSILDEVHLQIEEEHLDVEDPDPIEMDIQEDLSTLMNIIEEPILVEDILEDIAEQPPEPYSEAPEFEEPIQSNNTEQPMKEEKKDKPVKESFSLSMEDLMNLEVISDEILYSMDLESFDKFFKDVPDLDDFIEIDKEEIILNAKPDFNGLRLDSDRTASNDNFYEDIFSKKDDCDKNILLDTIFDVGDEREIPILKLIIVNEDNMGIRDKALKILNGISDQNYWYSEEEGAVLEIEKIRARCIFKPLFETADTETKLVLLDQIGIIGDTKELIFLNTQLITQDLVLKKKIVQTITQLKERIPITTDEVILEDDSNTIINDLDESNISSGILTFDDEIPIENVEKMYTVENFYNTKGNMPLDFCFLLEDLEISPSQPSDLLEVEFELGSIKDQATLINIENESKKKGDITTNTFLDQILSIPSILKDIFNG
ncbi:hypothetical protein OO009_07240 [Flavobacteriaceae bacterium KMM 6897]|nr:hypothetical protein [Flavobacteriaceae bacterium KMM 6897]